MSFSDFRPKKIRDLRDHGCFVFLAIVSKVGSTPSKHLGKTSDNSSV